MNLFLLPNNHSQMETTTTLNPTEKFFLHTEWTDEKHSLYLKGMEATFVNQLYASTDLIGLHLRTKNLLDQNSSRQMHCNTSNLFGQFKVCYRRTDPQLNKEDNFYNPMENPLNQYYCSPRCKLQAVTDPALQETAESMDSRSQALQEKIISCESATSSKHLHPNHDRCYVHDSEGSENEYVEVSDQNFAGEDIEGENASNICVQKRNRKRMKRPLTDYFNNAREDSSGQVMFGATSIEDLLSFDGHAQVV